MDDESNNEDVYEVEKIVGVRLDEQCRRRLYRVRWKGCASEDDTWEPHEHLLTCDDLLKTFKEEHRKKKHKKKNPKKQLSDVTPPHVISVKTEPFADDTDGKNIKAKRMLQKLTIETYPTTPSPLTSPASLVSPNSDMEEVIVSDKTTRKQRQELAKLIEQSRIEVDQPDVMMLKRKYLKKELHGNCSDETPKTAKRKRSPIIDDSSESISPLPVSNLAIPNTCPSRIHKIQSEIIDESYSKTDLDLSLVIEKNEGSVPTSSHIKKVSYVPLLEQLQQKRSAFLPVISPSASLYRLFSNEPKQTGVSTAVEVAKSDNNKTGQSTKHLLSSTTKQKTLLGVKNLQAVINQKISKSKIKINKQKETSSQVGTDNVKVQPFASKISNVLTVTKLVTNAVILPNIDTTAPPVKQVTSSSTDTTLLKTVASLKGLPSASIKTMPSKVTVTSRAVSSTVAMSAKIPIPIVEATTMPAKSTTTISVKTTITSGKATATISSNTDKTSSDTLLKPIKSSVNHSSNVLRSVLSNIIPVGSGTVTNSSFIKQIKVKDIDSNINDSFGKNNTMIEVINDYSDNSLVSKCNMSAETVLTRQTAISTGNEKSTELDGVKDTSLRNTKPAELSITVATPVKSAKYFNMVRAQNKMASISTNSTDTAETSITIVSTSSVKSIDAVEATNSLSSSKTFLEKSVPENVSKFNTKDKTSKTGEKCKKLSLQEYQKKRNKRSMSVPDESVGLFLEFTKISSDLRVSSSVDKTTVIPAGTTNILNGISVEKHKSRIKEKIPKGAQLAANTDILSNIIECITESHEHCASNDLIETQTESTINNVEQSENDVPTLADEGIIIEQPMDLVNSGESDFDIDLDEYSGDEDGLFIFNKPEIKSHLDAASANTKYLPNSIVYQAILSGDCDTLIRCCIKPEDINTCVHDDTLLMKAVMECAPKLVQIMLEKGANPNTTSSNGKTSLMVAVELNQKGLVVMLIENCAHLNIQTANGETALIMACKLGHMEIIHVLLNSGADVKPAATYLDKMLTNNVVQDMQQLHPIMHLLPSLQSTLKKHSEKLRDITKSVLEDLVQLNNAHLGNALMSCRCILPNEMEEYDFYFECDVNARTPNINVLLLALPVKFERNGRIDVIFDAKDNGIEDVLLNNEPMVEILPDNRCLYFLFPTIGEVNMLRIKTNYNFGYKVLLCVYTITDGGKQQLRLHQNLHQ